MTKKKADIGGKRLISLALEQWVRWLTILKTARSWTFLPYKEQGSKPLQL
ncbi:hypothetical protein [Aphanizomenon flos-aquae]|nr:hypothetical protein [Aphanizomenon flos-aquae]